MSRLFYDIRLREEYDHEGEPYKERPVGDEHFEKIKNWLPKEFEECKIHEAFDGILKDKVKSCTMRCIKNKDGCIARVSVDFIPGFRLSEKRREECWEQMDDQMADGFGETYDRALIPDGDGWQLQL